MRYSKASAPPAPWDPSTGEPPEESCFAAILQRKGKVAASDYTYDASIPIVSWLRGRIANHTTTPTTAVRFTEPFLELLESVKAAELLPAEYKAARRDGLLPKTQPCVHP